jgi:hypothetical protein
MPGVARSLTGEPSPLSCAIPGSWHVDDGERPVPDDFSLGLLAGLLIGEGHFGGDGHQPHVTLRMHVRHEAIFRWLERTFPGGKLYGPYHHGGRHYYQWMARGAYLRDFLMPLLESLLSPDIDEHSFNRFCRMRDSYTSRLARSRRTSSAAPDDSPVVPADESSVAAGEGPA